MNLPATSILHLLSAVVLLVLPLHAQTEPAAISFAEIVAKATADYKGEAIRLEPTAEGARLYTDFQKLVGHHVVFPPQRLIKPLTHSNASAFPF